MIKNFERIPMSGMSYDCMINGIVNIDVEFENEKS